MFGEDDLVRQHKPRADLIANFIVIAFAILLSRLWYLQIYSGKTLYRYSQENRLRKEVVRAPRGLIFSRNNDLLVYNAPRFDCIVTPQYLKNKKVVLEKLASLIGMPVTRIEEILLKNSTQARYIPIIIKKDLTRREVALIETENSKMPGVTVDTFITREYTDPFVGTHLLGYISEISQEQLPKLRKRDKFNFKLGDFIGQAGVEEQLDLELRGQDGYEFMEVDAKGRMKRYVRSDNFFKGIENQPARPGNNLRLTVDRDMQLAAYKAMEGKVGAVVAVDIHTGEVLTMVSRPSFDSGRFSTNLTSDYWRSLVQDELTPLRDRTIQDHFPPGSTFKPITAAAGLAEGLIDERTEVNCPGYFQMGSRTYHCWKKHGHGSVDVYRAIRESCDVFFYKLGMRLDIDVLAKYAKGMGLGSRLGIPLSRETPGLIPTKEWKKARRGQEWQLGETISCVIGQSYILVTPLQLAVAYGTMANGGKLYRPYVVKEIFSNSGDLIKKNKPELLSDIHFSPKTITIIRDGLFQVVNDPRGTAYGSRGEGIMMAGKTGTAQVIKLSKDKLFSACELMDYKHRNHGLFAAYAPANNPRIAIGVIIEHGCHGASAAGPVAKAVATAFMEKYYPDDLKANKEFIKTEMKAKGKISVPEISHEVEDELPDPTEER